MVLWLMSLRVSQTLQSVEEVGLEHSLLTFARYLGGTARRVAGPLSM